VPYIEGNIVLATLLINPGPLSNGVLESRDLVAATYSVSFPTIDANEWWEE